MRNFGHGRDTPLMTRAIETIVRLVEFVLAALLFGMVIMVATNVVLRYGFNSGLTFSEEMSRYFFVWLTFIGAVLAFKDHGHIGVETLVRRFNRTGRLICMAISNALIIFTSLGIGLIALYRLFEIVTGRVSDTEIARFAGEYEENKVVERAI